MLGTVHLNAIEKRGISPETAVRFGIYTGRSQGEAVTPDLTGNVLVFPYFEGGEVVAEKYRGPNKKFWQRTGGRKTFWNADILDDPSLVCNPLIITEGEFDALAAIDCGFPFTVSVQDGAPPVPKDKKPEDLEPIDPDREKTGKFEYMFNNRERLKKVSRFILAVDNDAPGKRLEAELLRRLSPSRCQFVTYPEGCKDLNDVLMKHGKEAVDRILLNARPYPVKGLYKLSDYPEREPIPTYSTGWSTLDQHLKLFLGEFMVVTGIPSMGKSSFVLNLQCNLYNNYGWRTALFSPEMPTVPHLRDKLRKIIGGENWLSRLNDAFSFIDVDPTGGDDDTLDLDWLIERAIDAVLRDGVQCFVIDPWNEIEHAKRRDESMTDYVAKSIRKLKRFAREYHVSVTVIAHPTKDIVEKGKVRIPTLYDVENSASWFNKADHGLCVHRHDQFNNQTSIFVQKVRFDGTGEKGEVVLKYDRQTFRYAMLDEGYDGLDGLALGGR